MKPFLSLALFALLSVASLAADYTVTVNSVLPSSQAVIRRKIAGATITTGKSLAVKADGTLDLYDANGAAPLNVFKGIALNSAVTGQPVIYVESDPEFTPGFTVAANAIVIGSATAGGLAPAADLATGHYLTIVGLGIGSNKIDLNPVSSGVVTP